MEGDINDQINYPHGMTHDDDDDHSRSLLKETFFPNHRKNKVTLFYFCLFVLDRSNSW